SKIFSLGFSWKVCNHSRSSLYRFFKSCRNSSKELCSATKYFSFGDKSKITYAATPPPIRKTATRIIDSHFLDSFRPVFGSWFVHFLTPLFSQTLYIYIKNKTIHMN